MRRRPPTVDQLMDLVAASWPADALEKDPLRIAVTIVRAAMTAGDARTRANRERAAARARRRRMTSAYRLLAREHDDVVKRAAREERVPVSQVIEPDGQKRSSRATRALALACWALKRGRKLSFPKTAIVTGLLDHTSVIWHVRRVDAEVAADPELGAKLRRLAA